MKRLQIRRIFLSLLSLASCGFLACDPEIEAIGEDPYQGGRASLGIALHNQAPSPEAAYPGEEVTFKARGVLAWADPEVNHYDFEFYIADEKVEIKSATDTSITVIVPPNVSSGITHILLQGQVFYGPNFTVLGNVKIDQNWGLKTGSNGPIFNFLEQQAQARSYYLLGGFSTLEGQSRTQVAYVSDRGVLADLASTRYNVRRPLRTVISNADGSYRNRETLNDMSYFSNGQVLLSGSFAYYEQSSSSNSSTYSYVNNITVLNNNLSLDTMHVQVQPWGTATSTTRIVPRFNGGTLQPIIRSFVTKDNKVLAVGNINSYVQADYARSSPLENLYNYTTVASVIRMERNGNLDVSYRSGSVTGAQGITDAYMDDEDRIVVVGEFTQFDGITANGIVRLQENGMVDPVYMANIGSGANGAISMVRYNETLGKAIIVGNFTSFNGKARQGVAVLNEDGTLDETFVPREIVGGRINFASILQSGKIVVSGTFQRYDGVARPGFLILDADGKSTQRFNVLGVFVGQLYQAVETLTTTGRNGLLLMGNFSRFNGQRINNVVMVEVDFE